ncbi:zf-CCHC domain-containing protein/DUF4219 domain-containing protein [Cephalotus follicularis]|uniref:Zf-CCHC domain-containing protein/DUF4219 domain-containing protein n=1 Tax=Cephalotus follicularis TaxID=3775 RepID=A0A1Q3AR57_CEPFO|nr:zf-CCHC domain-containing protein/DUF4219 domain-containing protein [Cephalotus follicularis]
MNLNSEESQNIPKPPYFDGNNYSHWMAKMTIFIQSLDYNLWDLIVDSPNLSTIRNENGEIIAKPRSSYDNDNRKSVQMNTKAKHIIIYAINYSDFNRVLSCISAKEMWDRLEVTYEGTNQVKEAKLVYIKSMFTRFTNITNALESLDTIYSNSEMIALITWKFKKFLASKKKFGDKPNKKVHQREESSKLEEVICFECNKLGHYKSDCPRLKKKEHLKKKKAMLATCDDSDESSSDEESHEEVAQLALMAIEEEEEEDNDEVSYDELVIIVEKYSSIIASLMKKFKSLTNENDQLKMSTLTKEDNSKEVEIDFFRK